MHPRFNDEIGTKANTLRKRRKSTRLPCYDYSTSGAYFVTLCTQNRCFLFGEVLNGDVILNPFGQIVDEEWRRSAMIRDEIELDEFVIMPNDLHAVIIIAGELRAASGPTEEATGRSSLQTTRMPRLPKRSLGSLVAGFKTATTKRINILRGTLSAQVWQRNFYDRIIREDAELERIRRYIFENPMRWQFDQENPAVLERAIDDPWL